MFVGKLGAPLSGVSGHTVSVKSYGTSPADDQLIPNVEPCPLISVVQSPQMVERRPGARRTWNRCWLQS